MWGDGSEDLSMHEAVALEVLQGLREHPFADPVDMAAQVGEAMGLFGQCCEHQGPQRPVMF